MHPRCFAAAALLRMSASGGQEPVPTAACSPAAAFHSAHGTASATVDLADALAPQPGSVSVNQPSRRRRGWGPVPGSAEQPRRSLSAMEGAYPGGSSAAAGAAEEVPRPHSVLGCEQQQQSPDVFSVYQDACSAQGTPPEGAEAEAAPGSSRSRRLSFSFGGGPGRTVARRGAKVSTWMWGCLSPGVPMPISAATLCCQAAFALPNYTGHHINCTAPGCCVAGRGDAHDGSQASSLPAAGRGIRPLLLHQPWPAASGAADSCCGAHPAPVQFQQEACPCGASGLRGTCYRRSTSAGSSSCCTLHCLPGAATG